MKIKRVLGYVLLSVPFVLWGVAFKYLAFHDESWGHFFMVLIYLAIAVILLAVVVGLFSSLVTWLLK